MLGFKSMAQYKFLDEDIAHIFNALRQATVKWKGRAEILRLSRKKVFVRRAKSGAPVYKYQWQCAICKEWYRNEADMEVDHITEIGGVGGFTGDWNETIFKIMPRPVEKYLQCLCRVCHLRKTKNFLSASKQWERKK